MTAVLPQKLVLTNANLRELSINHLPVIKDGKLEGHHDEPNSDAYIVLDGAPNVPLGFGLYVGKRQKSFVMQVRVGTRVKRITVGQYPEYTVNAAVKAKDARLLAHQMRVAMKHGVDIAGVRRQERVNAADTLGDVLDQYLAKYMLKDDARENSIKAIKAAMRRLTPWMHLSIAAIGSQTVDDIWKKLAKEQKHMTAAEQTLMWCRAAFNVYIEKRDADRNQATHDGRSLVNPFVSAKRLMRTRAQLEQEYEDKKTRNPLANTPERLGVWLDTLWERRAVNRDAVDYVLLTLLTGSRKSETAALAWAERLLDEGLDPAKHSVLTINRDGTKGTATFRKTKSGGTHTVPLGPFACQLMRRRFDEVDCGPYVFPASSTNPATKAKYYNSPREFIYSFRAVLEKTAMAVTWESCREIDPGLTLDVFQKRYQVQWYFTMHDLRRTFCTVAVNIEGMPYAVVQQLMNHGQAGNVTARYGRPSDEMLRKYMAQLEAELLMHSAGIGVQKQQWGVV